MTPKVEFLFDFGSPNAYLADQIIPQIEQRTGVRFDYVPILLGGVFKLTGNQSPAESLKGIKNKREQMERETERFIRKHGLTSYRFNPHFPVNTLALMRATVAAQKEGVFDAYIKAVFHFMWEEPRKMDDPAVFRESFDRIRPRCRQADRALAGQRRQEHARREHPARGRSRRVRRAVLLRRRRAVLRQGPASRCRGGDSRAKVRRVTQETDR